MSDPFDPAACGFFVVPNSFHRLRISCWMNNSSRPEPDVKKPGKVVSQFWANDEQKSPRTKWSSHPLRCWHAHAGSLELLQGLGSRHAGTRQELGEGLGDPMGVLLFINPFPSFPHSTCRTSNPTLVMEYIYIIIYRWEISHQTSVKTRTFNCHSWWHRRVNGHWYAQNWNERIHVRVS